MTYCIVCEQPPGEGYCEFCPATDRDPGDECDGARIVRPEKLIDTSDLVKRDVLIGSAPSRSEPVELLDVSVVHVTARSYKATFKCGDIYRTETIMGEDSYTETVNRLLDNPPGEGWVLIALTEMS